MGLSLTGLTFRKKADTEQVKYINMSLQIITCMKKEKEQDAVGENRGEYLHYVRQSKKNSIEEVTFKLGPEERNQPLEWGKHSWQKGQQVQSPCIALGLSTCRLGAKKGPCWGSILSNTEGGWIDVQKTRIV